MAKKWFKFKKVHKEVLEFIEDFKEIDDEVFDLSSRHENLWRHWAEIYLRGNCYFFANQIAKAFNGKIFIREDVGHAVAEVEGLLFDSRGIVADDIDPFDYVPSTPALESYAQAWSFNLADNGPSRDLYPLFIPKVVETTYDENYNILEDAGVEEDMICDILSDLGYWALGFIKRHCDIELYNQALDNGWRC